MKLSEMYPGRVGLPTPDMARVLNRQPQTLRRWAAYEDGPIRPIRINGRLLWPLADVQQMHDAACVSPHELGPNTTACNVGALRRAGE